MHGRIVPWSVAAVLLALWLDVAAARADTSTALGDRSGEGSTAFTGLAQAPEANLFTGALGTAIPIEVPPGRRNMTPQLSLRYTSSGGPSPFGHGWDLPIGRIERSTSWGVPRCTGAHTDDFVLVLPGGSSELVREAPSSSYYRPKVEQAWVRAEKLQTQNQWVVYDRSGLKYVFGADDSARVSNVSPPVFLTLAADGTCQLTTQWALSRIEDPNGNLIEVSWSKILNVLYPATVRWGANSQSGGPAHASTVRFLPEYRPPLDRMFSHRTGVAARLIWRIHRIDVETDVPAAGTLVRSYTLQYRDDAPGAAAEGYQSILSAVTVSGRPTQHFAYTPSVTGHQATTVTIAKPPGAHGELRVANPSLEVSQTVLDMNGDGLLDLVRSDDPSPSTWLVFRGFAGAGGFGFEDNGMSWQVPGNWTHLRNVVVSSSGCASGWSCTRTDTFDLTGDGIPDYVDASNGNAWVVYAGRGVPQWGFAAGVAWPAPNRQYIRRTEQSDIYQDVVDVTGDGLPDLIVSGVPGQQPPYEWDVYPNTGSGFELSPLPRWPAPVNTLAEHSLYGLGHQLADFNGDGLPDVVKIAFPQPAGGYDPRCSPSANAQASCLEVYLNEGQGFGAVELIAAPLSWAVQMEGQGIVVQDVTDINGDGLPDWVEHRFDHQLGDYEPYWRVLLNLGGTLEPVIFAPHSWLPPPATEAIPARIWGGADGPLRRTVDGNARTDLLDVNGDGFLDQVTAGGPSWSVRLHAAVEKPNLLGLMENGLGGTNTIVYRPSTAYDNTGGDAQPDMPYLVWVVDKTRQNDGQCVPPPGADVFTPGPAPSFNPCIDAGSELVARFHYQDGRFDAVEREFRGFRRVVRTSVEGSADPANLTASYFGQQTGLAGRLLQVDTYAGDTTLVRSELNFWGTRTVGGTRTQIWLAQNARSTFDLITSGAPQYVAMVSDPPDDYGNVTHHYRAGLFGAARVDTYTSYATPQGSSRVYDRPSNVRIDDASGILEERWFYYDGSGVNGMSLGKVTTGNLKRIKSRLNPTTANGPETKMAYDAFGNLTQATDANGRTTSTTYDSARRLYPHTVTNPLGHQTVTEIDYRWGQPLSVRDPNGATTFFDYDSAGRRTCIARPPDTTANCSVHYTYHFASQPGELSWVESAARQDTHADLTNRQFFDALGRPRYSERLQAVDGAPVTVRANHAVYDAGGRLRTLHHPYLASAGAPNNGATTYDYHLNGSSFVDPLGRVYRTVNPDATSRRTEYTAATTATTDEGGQRSETVSDPHGRVTVQRLFDGAAPYATTERTYDGLGRLLQVRQNGVVTQALSYDSLGRKTQLVDADSGTWRYGYDGVGNLLWQEDPQPNRHVQFCYDAINRPTRRCPIASSYQQSLSCTLACGDPETVLYAYDANGVANSRGRLTLAVDGSGATEILAYDIRGRRTRVLQSVDAGSGGQATYEYAYDTNDRVVSIRYPDGETVLTEYDAAGQPIALRNSSNDFYVVDARYDIFGRPTLIAHENGVIDVRTYGGPLARHRLQGLAADKDGVKLLDLSFDQYSPRGLLGRITDQRNLLGEISNTAVFSYDAIGRLTSYDSVHAAADRLFTYDAMGNMTRNGDHFLTYDDPARPHQLTRINVGSPTGPAQAVTHDANGNRTGKQTQWYQYDTGGRLTEVGTEAATVSFVYAHDGRRAAKIVAGASPVVTRYYGELAETTAGHLTKSYSLAGIRVASRTTSYTAWESASVTGPGPIRLAAASMQHPALIVVLTREAQWIVAAVALSLVTGVLALPGRRRAIVGVRVRPGQAILVAIACAVGTMPWPILVQPRIAEAGGSGGSGSGNVVRHYHLDHLGSTQVITDRNGAIVEQIRYAPYGQIRARWNASGQPLSGPSTVNRREFGGYDNETFSGLQYAGARFYDPELGLFLTHDPATQFASPYAFGGGDPVNWTDPNGAEFGTIIIALLVASVVSAALNAIVAAAQGLPASAIGKAALGGAIAGAVGVGLGVVASAASMGAAAAAGSLPASVTFDQALTVLGDVATRSAFSSTIANAAGQIASAAGASGDVTLAVSMTVGLFASVAYDQAFLNPSGDFQRIDTGGNGGVCSTTGDHADITLAAAADAGFGSADANAILEANLAQDRGTWTVLNNQSHFDYGAQQAVENFDHQALNLLKPRNIDRPAFLDAIGRATHHIQDQYALGHQLPGTSALKGVPGAPFRFIIHNVIGGEVAFRQASYDATRDYLQLMQGLSGGSL
jgi:RHS repeat-associated protein